MTSLWSNFDQYFKWHNFRFRSLIVERSIVLECLVSIECERNEKGFSINEFFLNETFNSTTQSMSETNRRMNLQWVMDITVSAFAPTRNNHLSCLHIQTWTFVQRSETFKADNCRWQSTIYRKIFYKSKVYSVLSIFRENNEDASM